MLAVTGSTGALGGLVARAVADLDPVLLVRDASRAPDLGCEVRVAGYSDVGAAATLSLLRGAGDLERAIGTRAPPARFHLSSSSFRRALR